MQVRVDGRSAIVTGGSKGIGLAIATELAASGAKVTIVARGEASLAQAKTVIAAAGSGDVQTVSADIGTAAGANAAFAAAVKAFGKVDILVNNAGVSATGAFEGITDEAWQTDLDLKLFAAIRLARLALPGMRAQRWGRIINILNTGAKTPRAGSAPTTISRAAGMALTKVLAGEFAPDNILVNAILVGLIESDQWVRRHAAQGDGQPYVDFLKGMAGGIPLGRVGTAQELANLAVFLASEANGYVTGTAINVDGGSSPVV